ncbi:MAG: glycosyltransferase, partial [Ktedonobacterales bacterium]
MMINQRTPDFTDTPASSRRPRFSYIAEPGREPLVSIITAYGTDGDAFQETARAVERMSVPYWEWLIVVDGGAPIETPRHLTELAEREPRARVIQQARHAPGAAHTRAVAEARAPYLLYLDAGDLVEPTFVEKALWFLATQPRFAACDSYSVAFGGTNQLCPRSFHEREPSDEQGMTFPLLIRRDACENLCGQDDRTDTRLRRMLAEAGMWSYTLPEYLTWSRTQARSSLSVTTTGGARTPAFRAGPRAKQPTVADPLARREPSLATASPFLNPLPKPAGKKRLLLVAPWLAMGWADKFNLDLIAQLAARDYECTVVTTAWSEDAWLDQFAALTPDIFRLHRFLTWAEYPRFIDYLIASRECDALLISSSELGYELLPYLRSRHPNLPILDFTHMEEEAWRNGGYPAISVAAGSLLDRRLVCSEQLRAWEIERGAPAETTHTIYCGTDTTAWHPDREDTAGARARIGVGPETPLILFAGRMVEQKRPQLVGEILL